LSIIFKYFYIEYDLLKRW